MHRYHTYRHAWCMIQTKCLLVYYLHIPLIKCMLAISLFLFMSVDSLVCKHLVYKDKVVGYLP